METAPIYLPEIGKAVVYWLALMQMSQAAWVRRAGRFVEQQFYQCVCALPQQLAQS